MNRLMLNLRDPELTRAAARSTSTAFTENDDHAGSTMAACITSFVEPSPAVDRVAENRQSLEHEVVDLSVPSIIEISRV